MALVKEVRIQGCSKEYCSWTKVDLSEPNTIGQHPNHPEHYCHETPLQRTITLEASQVGKTIFRGVKIADVYISCPAIDCPNHT